MVKIIPITDFDAPELDVYARLTENQLLCREHPEQGLFIAESPVVIERALDAGFTPVSFLLETRHVDGQATPLLARCGDIPAYTAELDVLTRLTGFPLTRGLLCAMRRPALPEPEAICRSARRVAVLEDVMNPTNVGAIFRSAAALGVDAVLLTRACSDPLYRRAIRLSMGTVFQVPWTFVGPDFGRWAFRRRQWRCATIPFASATRAFARCPGSPSCSGPRATGSRRRPFPAATIRCASRWRTAWTL